MAPAHSVMLTVSGVVRPVEPTSVTAHVLQHTDGILAVISVLPVLATVQPVLLICQPVRPVSMLMRLSSVEIANHVMLTARMLTAARLLGSVQETAILAMLRMEIPALVALTLPVEGVPLVACQVAASRAPHVPPVTRTSVPGVQREPSLTPQPKPASPATRPTAKPVTQTIPPNVTPARMVGDRTDQMAASAVWTLTAPCAPLTTTSVPPAQMVTV